jgi:hypothetical protein
MKYVWKITFLEFKIRFFKIESKKQRKKIKNLHQMKKYNKKHLKNKMIMKIDVKLLFRN